MSYNLQFYTLESILNSLNKKIKIKCHLHFLKISIKAFSNNVIQNHLKFIVYIFYFYLF